MQSRASLRKIDNAHQLIIRHVMQSRGSLRKIDNARHLSSLTRDEEIVIKNDTQAPVSFLENKDFRNDQVQNNSSNRPGYQNTCAC
jgi:hypothetical protein